MESKVAEIIEILQPLCPTVDLKHPNSRYYTLSIEEMIEVFKKLDKNPFTLSYSELIRVEILNNVIAQMKEDLLDKDKCQFFLEMSKDENPSNDFERGIYAAIALLKFRVHCICD